MIGKWFLRIGVGVLAAAVAGVQGVLQGATFDEWGVYAGIAGAVVAVLTKFLGDLGRKLPE